MDLARLPAVSRLIDLAGALTHSASAVDLALDFRG
jgi:hypothetical protein